MAANFVPCRHCQGPVQATDRFCGRCRAVNPSFRRKTSVVNTIAFVAIAGLVVGAYYVIKNENNEKKAGDREARSHPRDVDAEQLVKDYDANEVSADAQYKGDWLRVSGTAGPVTKDFMDNVHMTLDVKGTLIGVSCDFDDTSQLASVRPGQKIVLVCKGGGRTLTVPDLRECAVESVGESAVQKVDDRPAKPARRAPDPVDALPNLVDPSLPDGQYNAAIVAQLKTADRATRQRLRREVLRRIGKAEGVILELGADDEFIESGTCKGSLTAITEMQKQVVAQVMTPFGFRTYTCADDGQSISLSSAK